VRDVEKCLSRLEYWDQQLIARAILQEHSHTQTAYLLNCSRKTVQRRVQEVLDLLGEDFLKSRLLTELPMQKD
jgi:DNA-directed RNA polymerase specialized sigma24 family protein